jgi:hypothetical protein
MGKPDWRFPADGWEWHRKPLKSLKTDSEMAIRQLAVAGK